MLLRQVPSPIPGATSYLLEVSPSIGISKLSATLRFDSPEACEQETIRFRGLLRGKYDECRDYRFSGDVTRGKPLGRCDSTGLPVIRITSNCAVSSGGGGDSADMDLSYELLEPSERDAIAAAAKEGIRVGADHL